MTRRTISYFTLPGILPRLKQIFASGFSYVAFYMALVLNMVRLLPDNHPYLNFANFGRFGLVHVLWQAWKNLDFTRKNIDQIIIFFTLIGGVLLLFLQLTLFIMALSVPLAEASIGAEFARFFVTQNPDDDLAFMFLDRVFGLENIFNSRVTTEGNWPTNFHAGMHDLFEYYNTGLALIAFILILYFVITITAESAQTGVPFGQRFNGAMAPIRLILALGLLVPITSGMNGGQLMTLYVAKWGSSMATNGWQLFLDEATYSFLGDPDILVVTPNPPQANVLVEFMFVAVTCRYAYEFTSESNPDPTRRYEIRPYVITGPQSAVELGQGGATDLNGILGLNGNKNVTIRFGHLNDEWYNEYAGGVKPLCGEIEVNLQDITEPGAYYVQNAYIMNLILGLWNDNPNNTYARNMVRSKMSTVQNHDPTLPPPQEPFIQDTFDYFNDQTLDDVEQGVLAQAASGGWLEDFTQYGWGGAAIWYNKIAQYNGSLISSVYNLPTPKKYPILMEEVHTRKRAQNNNIQGRERFRPVLADGTPVHPTGLDQEMADLFYDAQQVWAQTQSGDSGNFMIDAINMLLGVQGLINMRDNVDIHPLAQLVGVGRSLMESAVQNFGYSIGGSVFGSLAGKGPVQKVMQNASSFFSMVATITFSIGFILFYVLPFLPFLYFFVALTSWVKTIFEAMVGVPLWALAHIRIDGVGIPGPAGMNGYYLVFEIFISPLLIVIGMLAGISIFGAQVKVLNEVWYLVISNLTGHDSLTFSKVAEDKVGSISFIRGALDKFFYTAMYAVVVYMMGLASFKLVDRIPNGILRWMGTGVKSFDESGEGMAGELVEKSYNASQSAAGNMSSVANMSLLK